MTAPWGDTGAKMAMLNDFKLSELFETIDLLSFH